MTKGQGDWFIIATVRIDKGTTQELYGPFDNERSEEAAAYLMCLPSVVRCVITESMALEGFTN